MKKFFKRLIIPAYLGAVLGFLGLRASDWELYLILFIFFLLVKVTDFNRDDFENE